MIATVSGKVNHVEPGSVVVEVGGVGLLVNVPVPVSDLLQPGEAVFLHTQLIVRQDSLALYGFDSPEGREFFIKQLTKAGQMLGDLWVTAWHSAPPDTYLTSQLAKRKLAKKQGVPGSSSRSQNGSKAD